MVPPASHKLTGVRGTQVPTRAMALCFAYGALTLSGGTFQSLRLARHDPLRLVLQPQHFQRSIGLGCSPFARHYLGNLVLISCRAATEMFQFTAGPSRAYIFSTRCLGITPGGLPHSDSQGSSLVCSSPCTFRRSPRPSSAFSAWASSSYSLALVGSTSCCLVVCLHGVAAANRQATCLVGSSRTKADEPRLHSFFLPSAKLK